MATYSHCVGDLAYRFDSLKAVSYTHLDVYKRQGLGVAYVISGDFAGWNFGLQQGGWGGLLIATLLMATMYLSLIHI